MRRKILLIVVFPVLLWYAHSKTMTGVFKGWLNRKMLLDSVTIKAAVAGEKWATEKVIEHYAPMIDELAVDEDMKQHLIMKLLEALPNFPMEQA